MTNRVQIKAVMTREVILNAHDCPACGIVFAMPDNLEKDRRRDSKLFYCPNGHGINYSESPDRALLREAQDQITRMQAEREKLKRALDDERGASARLSNDLMDKAKELKSLKTRAGAGVCAQCNRQFANVARHVRSKHEHIPQPPEAEAEATKAGAG